MFKLITKVATDFTVLLQVFLDEITKKLLTERKSNCNNSYNLLHASGNSIILPKFSNLETSMVLINFGDFGNSIISPNFGNSRNWLMLPNFNNFRNSII